MNQCISLHMRHQTVVICILLHLEISVCVCLCVCVCVCVFVCVCVCACTSSEHTKYSLPLRKFPPPLILVFHSVTHETRSSYFQRVCSKTLISPPQNTGSLSVPCVEARLSLSTPYSGDVRTASQTRRSPGQRAAAPVECIHFRCHRVMMSPLAEAFPPE